MCPEDAWTETVCSQTTSPGRTCPGLRAAAPWAALAWTGLLVACEAATPAPDGAPPPMPPSMPPPIQRLEVGTEARLQAVFAVDDRRVWVSGVAGTVARTLDGGDTWEMLAVPGAEELEFRDVHAFDEDRAVLLASGQGEASRVYLTEDGGRQWRETFRNHDPEGFYNCFAFAADGSGALVGDPLDGALPVLTTQDAEVWSPLPTLPSAGGTEAGFAASGTCLSIDSNDGELLLGTGGGVSRLHRYRGGSWTVDDVPLAAPTETAGVTSIARSAAGTLALGGGDVAARDAQQEHLLVASESGWTRVTVPGLVGPIFGIAWGLGEPGREPLLVAAPGGLALRSTGGVWHRLSSESHWAVAVSPSGETAWAVGPAGLATRILLGEATDN